MRAPDRTTSRSSLQVLLTAAAVIAALYFGRKLLVPLAFGLLFSFLLSTPLTCLERIRVPRVVAVFLVLITGISVAGVLMWLGVNEFGGILKDWPQYQANISSKIQAVRGAPGAGIQNLERTFAELKQDFAVTAATSSDKPSDKPVPVTVVSGSTLMSSLGFAGATAAEVLAELFAVVVLTLFILLNREQLRNRILRLFGEGRLVELTTTFDEAASRVSRYLLSQLAVNGCFGLILFLGLFVIGVPYAPLWGVLVLVLRFVPYAGTLIAGTCPFVMSLASFQGWQKPLETFALYAGIELTVSSVIEPYLYANRTGISSVAYLLSAAFWTLIWGPIGLVLSTPLTVCLVVMGRHLPPLEFLHVLLGDEPVLQPNVRFYQRLLAEDEDEATNLIEEGVQAAPLPQVIDTLVIPALIMAEQDRHEGRLMDQHARVMYDLAREMIEVAGEHHPCAASAPTKYSSIVCIPARDEADELIANVLAQFLRQCGGHAEFRKDATFNDELAVISALPPFAMIHARTVCKRIRAAHPNVHILLGVWGSETAANVIQERLGAACADWVVTSTQGALEVITANLCEWTAPAKAS